MEHLIYGLALIIIGFLFGLEYGEYIQLTCKITCESIKLAYEVNNKISEIDDMFAKIYPENAKIQRWNFNIESIKEFQSRYTIQKLVLEDTPKRCKKCDKECACIKRKRKPIKRG